MRTILILCLSILFLPLTLTAQDNPLDLSQGNITITTNGTYTITSNSSETNNHIIVNENLDNVSITLKNVKVKIDNTSPMIIKNGTKVTLILEDENSLICNSPASSRSSYPGLDIQSNAEVTIQGNGKLTAEGGEEANYFGAPGIRCTEATLIIDEGTIIANGNISSAGINIPKKSNLIIRNGNITANGGNGSAGIGGNWSDSCGSIQITGGTVKAKGSSIDSGIGSGRFGGAPEKIIITGGDVTAISSESLPIGNNPGIYICTVDVKQYTDDKETPYKGDPITFTNGLTKTADNEFTVKGDLTLPVDFTLGNGQTLKIEEGAKLTITDDEGTFTNNGGTIEVYGELIGEDKITGSGGTINQYYDVTYDGNEGNGDLPEKQSCKGGENANISFEKTPTRQYYTFLGWDTNKDATDATYTSDGTTQMPVNGNTTLYAIWKPNAFTIDNSTEVEQIYGKTFNNIDLSTLITKAEEDKEYSPITSYTLSSTLTGLSLNGSILSGRPYVTVQDGQDVTIKVSNGITSLDKDLTIKFKISQRELNLKITENQLIYKDEKASYKVDFSLTNTLEDETPAYEGKLTIADDGALSLNGLSLEDNGNFKASNYKLALQDGTKVTILDKNASEVVAEPSAPAQGSNNWFTSDITLQSPEGFTIEGKGIVQKSSSPQTSIIISEEGNYQYEYTLVRLGTSRDVTYDVLLDKTTPELTGGTPSVKYKEATFTLTDNVSGIASYSYNLDNKGGVTVNVDNAPLSLSFKLSDEVGEHTIDLTVTDKAGHSKEYTNIKFELKAEPKPVNPPVIPDDPDDPAPVRYTVTLPTVEGAATDPAAGSYEVESWGNFSFLLTLGEGYRKDSHPVVTARGETLTPNASTGKYIIRNVQSDITVGITGIVKDVATGNESLSDGFHITTSGRLLLVTVPRATRLYLTDTSGRLILSRLLPAGDTRIDDLAAGVYFLTLEGEKTKKIIIR